jgi:hypothetical protein
MNINVLSWDSTLSDVIYGGDTVRIFPLNSPPNGVSSLTYDLLQCWSVEVGSDEVPYKLHYKVSAVPKCQKCNNPDCVGSPPPPAVPPGPPPPGSGPNVAFKLNTFEFTPPQANFRLPSTLGPIWVNKWATNDQGEPQAPTSVQSLALACQIWVDSVGLGGLQEVAFHVYNVFDPAGRHPLHQTTIGIPVATTSPS